MSQLAERLDPETLLERIDPQWRDHWMDPTDALEYYRQVEPKRYARAVKSGGNGIIGVDHHSAKLDPVAVLDIRTRRLSQRAFASLYQVSSGAISHIQSGRNWRHV